MAIVRRGDADDVDAEREQLADSIGFDDHCEVTKFLTVTLSKRFGTSAGPAGDADEFDFDGPEGPTEQRPSRQLQKCRPIRLVDDHPGANEADAKGGGHETAQAPRNNLPPCGG